MNRLDNIFQRKMTVLDWRLYYCVGQRFLQTVLDPKEVGNNAVGRMIPNIAAPCLFLQF
jgi:hypothetical protein